MKDIQEAFAFFDRDNDGRVSMPEVANILRVLGYAPTQADLNTYTKHLLPTSTSNSSINSVDAGVDFETLETFIKSTLAPPPTQSDFENKLLDAFRIFDKEGTGRIGTAELRHIVTTLGDRLSEAEADEMIAMADPDHSGYVKYGEFVEKLINV